MVPDVTRYFVDFLGYKATESAFHSGRHLKALTLVRRLGEREKEREGERETENERERERQTDRQTNRNL